MGSVGVTGYHEKLGFMCSQRTWKGDGFLMSVHIYSEKYASLR